MCHCFDKCYNIFSLTSDTLAQLYVNLFFVPFQITIFSVVFETAFVSFVMVFQRNLFFFFFSIFKPIKSLWVNTAGEGFLSWLSL